MTTKTEQATQTTPVAKKEPLGVLAVESIRCTLRTGLRYRTGIKNLKAMEVWLPKYLVPTSNGNYIPINPFMCLIGKQESVDVKRGWILPKAEVLKVPGLLADDEGIINLFQPASPWLDEICWRPYLARMCAICNLDVTELAIGSAAPRAGLIMGG